MSTCFSPLEGRHEDVSPVSIKINRKMTSLDSISQNPSLFRISDK